jgi:LmbE family N-acetylglucosaminyl deacetylase
MPRQDLPRKLYRDLRARRATREENSFNPTLRTDPDAPELLLSPHWDDAVLDCWSLLADGRRLTVANVFAGMPAPGRVTHWDAVTGATDSAQRAAERLAEDAVALARAERRPVSLPFLDTQYRSGSPTLEQIDAALSAELPSASRVYAPAAIGSHPDHVLTRRYARMLLRTGMPVVLYADLPYCVTHGWPHWVDGREFDAHRNVDALWRSYLRDVPEMPELRAAHVERLDERAAAAKLEAMSCYATQFPALDAGAVRVLSNPAIHGFEVRWELVRDGG